MSTRPEPGFAAARAAMVDRQLVRRGVSDERVLAAMRTVPRECFVPKAFAEEAYDDHPLPIAEGQTISQPFIVAHMIEAARVGPGDRVLEVGTGSGYAAAVLAVVAGSVVTIERHTGLAHTAADTLAALGIGNVAVHVGDGTRGRPEEAPFDAIIVTAGGPSVPESLQRQLAIGGRLVIPVGRHRIEQRLVRITRTGETDFEEEDLGAVAFVPLVGEEGWSDQAGRSA